MKRSRFKYVAIGFFDFKLQIIRIADFPLFLLIQDVITSLDGRLEGLAIERVAFT
jgi:hypothetical protein